MELEIIEIGTSDFRTKAGEVDGLFIEPVKTYFDALPECRKENVAVSNFQGQIPIFYIPLDKIQSLGLPNWVRGCNSVGEPHPTAARFGWSDHVVADVVEVVRIKTLLDKYGISAVKELKIDTEGHDIVILNDFLDTSDILPDKIVFESNALTDKVEEASVVSRLEKLGYFCKKIKSDMHCER